MGEKKHQPDNTGIFPPIEDDKLTNMFVSNRREKFRIVTCLSTDLYFKHF